MTYIGRIILRCCIGNTPNHTMKVQKWGRDVEKEKDSKAANGRRKRVGINKRNERRKTIMAENRQKVKAHGSPTWLSKSDHGVRYT